MHEEQTREHQHHLVRDSVGAQIADGDVDQECGGEDQDQIGGRRHGRSGASTRGPYVEHVRGREREKGHKEQSSKKAESAAARHVDPSK